MKKILTVITTQFVPYGGLTTVAMNYYLHIDHTRFKMDFASTNDAPEELQQKLRQNGNVYYKLPTRKKLMQYYSVLKKLCRSYDVVHIHANSATATLELSAAKAAGVKKRIIHIHNTTCSHMVVHRMLKPIFDKTYTDAIACSKAAGEWIFPSGKYLVLNNAIDLDRYAFSEENRQDVREELGLKDALVVGHVGKMVYQKNHEFLINVFAKLHVQEPNSKLLLVGDGELRNNIESQIEQLGLTDAVVLIGMVNSAERYLSAMDCFVFPSRWEGLPLSVLEAQVNGLTCVVSDKVTREVGLTDSIYFLPIDRNEEKLTEKWACAISNQRSISRNSQSSQNCEAVGAAGFDIRLNVSRLEEVYHS